MARPWKSYVTVSIHVRRPTSVLSAHPGAVLSNIMADICILLTNFAQALDENTMRRQSVRSQLIARSTQHTQYALSQGESKMQMQAESLDRATVLTLMIRVDAGTGLLSVISVQVPENMANLQVL